MIATALTFSQSQKQLIEEVGQLTFREGIASRAEVAIPYCHLLAWLEAQNHSCQFYWCDRGDEFAMAGIGLADHIVSHHVLKDDSLFAQVQSRLQGEYRYQKYYAGLTFDDAKMPDELWEELTQSHFVLPLIEVVHSPKGTFLACNLFAESQAAWQQLREQAIALIQGISWPAPEKSAPYHLVCQKRQDSPSHSQWLGKVSDVLNDIEEGQLQKVVMARRSSLTCNEPVHPVKVLRKLSITTQDCFQFCFRFNDRNAFIGASPERLFQRKERLVRSEALAGTRPRGESEAEDRLLSIELMSSRKDIHEHRFVVEQIVQDLNPLCESLRVNREVSLIKLHRGQHLFTGVKGLLKDEVKDSLLLQVLHPTPAIGGTPRAKALETIRENEPFFRGWYSGPVGWIAYDSVEFAVAIRSALIKDNQMHLFSGAGIVKGSSPEAEWDEIENKIANFLEIVQGGQS